MAPMMENMDQLPPDPIPVTHLSNHSTHQIMLGIEFGINLMMDRNPLEAMHYRAGVCVLQREIALRVKDGRISQGMPDLIADYDA